MGPDSESLERVLLSRKAAMAKRPSLNPSIPAGIAASASEYTYELVNGTEGRRDIAKNAFFRQALSFAFGEEIHKWIAETVGKTP